MQHTAEGYVTVQIVGLGQPDVDMETMRRWPSESSRGTRRFAFGNQYRCPACEARGHDEAMKQGWVTDATGIHKVMWCPRSSCPLYREAWEVPTDVAVSAGGKVLYQLDNGNVFLDLTWG